MSVGRTIRQAAETDRLAACAPQQPTCARYSEPAGPACVEAEGGVWPRHGQMTRAQLFHIWQLVQSAQAEMIEKKLRRFVQKRPARDFGATGDFNQAAFHQCLQHAIDVTPRTASTSARVIGWRYAMIASVSSAGALRRAGFGAGKAGGPSWRIADRWPTASLPLFH